MPSSSRGYEVFSRGDPERSKKNWIATPAQNALGSQ